MSLFTAVEIDLSIFTAIVMIDGHAVGIAVIAVDGKHASFCLNQDFTAFLCAQGLPESCDFSEHPVSSSMAIISKTKGRVNRP
jgi:hypothetical protein